MFVLIFGEKAIEFLEKLELKTKERILNKILLTKEQPFRYFERLTKRNEYRLRVGNYRIIADIDEKSKKITVHIIGHRKNIYKKY